MDDDRLDLVCRIVRRACEAPPESRDELIHDLCQGDASLEAEVREALEPDPVVAGVLDVPDDAAQLDPLIGRELRGFRIESCLGLGGMGAVYRATQLSTGGVVALKFIHPHHLAHPFGTSGRRRFDSEIRTLARLEHPGIAKVHSAWTADWGEGVRPFFAMELVDGVPIDRSLQTSGLGVDDVVRMLADAAEALGHAHQRGVIHRDIKPQNLLVDREGRVRLIDFGIARASNPGDLTPPVTTAGGQPIGTVSYMSPEQLTTPADVDVRTDVYSLGTVAYELLAGRHPFELEGLPLAAAAHVVVEKEPPALGTLAPKLDPDLVTVISKAMDKDPRRRYAGAAELAADLRRVLGHEPIQARPATRMYLARKFVRRNRGLAAGLAAALGGLSLGAGAATASWMRAESQRKLAEDSARQNDSLKWGMFDAVAEAAALAIDPLLADQEDIAGYERAVRARATAMLERAQSPSLHPEARAAIYRTVGSVYEELGDLGAAEAMYRRLIEFRQSADGADHPDTAAARASLALVLLWQGRVDEGAVMLDQAVPALLAQPQEPWKVEAAAALDNFGFARRLQGNYAQSERLYRKELDVRRQLRGPNDLDYAQAEHNYALLLIDDDRPKEAEQLLRHHLVLFEIADGAGSERVVRVLRSLGLALRQMGRPHDAIPLLRRGVRAVEDSRLADSTLAGALQVYLGGSMLDACEPKGTSGGQVASLIEAKEVLTKAVALLDAAPEAPAALVAEAKAELARALLLDGKPGEAKDLLEHARTAAGAAPHPPRVDRRIAALHDQIGARLATGEE